MPESFDQLDYNKESQLLCSLCAHPPVGFNKHFNMMACLISFNAGNSSDVDSEELWKYFNSKYHQDRLNELHKIPFPNDEMDYDLYESSDDNTLSGASTPINVQTPQLPSSRKRKSATTTTTSLQDNSLGSMDQKSQTPTVASRRRDRSDSEKNERSESTTTSSSSNKHSHRHRSDKDNKDKDKDDKMDKIKS
nr:MRG/MORF4L-binding protein-like [Dermatophagoides farinae]